MTCQAVQNSGVTEIRFGAKIRARRAELEKTQQQIADSAGVHRNLIWKVEAGKTEIEGLSRKNRIALAHALSWTLEELTGEAETPVKLVSPLQLQPPRLDTRPAPGPRIIAEDATVTFGPGPFDINSPWQDEILQAAKKDGIEAHELVRQMLAQRDQAKHERPQPRVSVEPEPPESPTQPPAPETSPRPRLDGSPAEAPHRPRGGKR